MEKIDAATRDENIWKEITPPSCFRKSLLKSSSLSSYWEKIIMHSTKQEN